jgi:hypothetical protein
MLEYNLEAVGGARPALSKTEKAKAKSDGEDVARQASRKGDGNATGQSFEVGQ